MKLFAFVFLLFPLITFNFFQDSHLAEKSGFANNKQEMTFEEIKEMVKNQKFIFIPTTIRVKGGSTTTLTSNQNRVRIEGNNIELKLEVILTKEIAIANRPFLNYDITGTIANINIKENEKREIIRMKFDLLPDEDMHSTRKRKMKIDFTFYKGGKTNLNLYSRGVYIPYTGYTKPLLVD
ncbi:MAG: DUF4251 domain-containing protein [Bacteroidales bacterium]|nr:DUF4251 domain-containing protein [Bacteroidales bacterium]